MSTQNVTPETILMVPPDALLANDNSRFGLKKTRLETLKTDILNQGEIHTPLDVESLPAPIEGKTYKIVDGHYRQAAAMELTSSGTPILCPIRVHPAQDDTLRLKRQVSFNLQRENPTPMDMAVAIHKLLEAKVPRQEIMAMYAKSGGRKGDKVAPLSNSYLNMMVSFLEFPKNIQNLIHQGIITVGGAYTLTRKPKDKWAEIVADCEKDYAEQQEREVKDEERFLAAAKKEQEELNKVKDLEAKAVEAREKLKGVAAQVDAAAQVEGTVTVTTRTAKSKEEKEAAAKALAEAQAKTKEAIATAEAAKKEADKLDAQLKKIKEAADERAKRLAQARKEAEKNAKDAKKKAIGKGEIDKAAGKAGVGDLVPLNATQMRQTIKDWTLPGSHAKVAALMTVVGRVFSSELTPTQGYTEMAKITGEHKAAVKAKKEAVA